MGKNKKVGANKQSSQINTQVSSNVGTEVSQNKKNDKKNKKNQNQQVHSHDAACGDDHQHDHEDDSAHQHQESNEPQLTPQEKAQQYKDMQTQIYQNFIKDFEQDEQSLHQELAGAISEERKREFEKREKEEFKKLDKVFKKDAVEVDELYNQFSGASNKQTSLKAFRDRIAKTIQEIQKQQKLQQKQALINAEQEKAINKMKADIQSNMNKKSMLSNLCKGLLEKNYELYVKHETMLEEEKVERQKLAQNFQDQMKEVTQELESQKKFRSEELNENQAIRQKIQEAINEYKKKEEVYRSKMDQHSKVVQDIEKKLRVAIEGSISKTLKEAEAEKQKFQRSCDNVMELSQKINGFMEKFDKIKEEMGENGKKFESYQVTVETKKLEMQTLETEIQNIQLQDLRQRKFQAEAEDERKKSLTQIEALKKLKNALTEQHRNLVESMGGDKENVKLNV